MHIDEATFASCAIVESILRNMFLVALAHIHNRVIVLLERFLFGEVRTVISEVRLNYPTLRH